MKVTVDSLQKIYCYDQQFFFFTFAMDYCCGSKWQKMSYQQRHWNV